MALTLEQENAIRARNGMLPIAELPAQTNPNIAPIPQQVITPQASIPQPAAIVTPPVVTPSQPVVPKTKEQIDLELKQQEESKKKAEEELALKKQQELTDSQAKELEEIEKTKRKPKVEPVAELDDEKVLEYLQKKKGLKVSSFEDMVPKPTPQDEEKAKEEREADKVVYGLKNGKFSKKTYEGYITDTKNPAELVYADFEAKAKSKDADLTDDQIRDLFNEKFGLNAEPGTWQHEQGQENLSILSERIINKKYPGIVSLESDYTQHETRQNQVQSEQTRILANAPAYKKDVVEAFSALSVKKVAIGDKTFDIPVPQEFLDKAMEKMTDNGFAAPRIAKGWDVSEIQEIARTMVDIENQGYFMQKAAEAYHEEHQKGVRGIVPDNAIQRIAESTLNLTENQRKAAERHGAIVPDAKNN